MPERVNKTNHMKAFFLTGSIVFTVIILILAFENMGLSCNGFLYVFIPFDSPFMMVLALSITGIFSGVFYTGLIMNMIGNKGDEEAPGNEW